MKKVARLKKNFLLPINVKKILVFLLVLVLPSYLLLSFKKDLYNDKVYLYLLLVGIFFVFVFFKRVRDFCAKALNYEYSDLYFFGYRVLLSYLLVHTLPTLRSVVPSNPLPIIQIFYLENFLYGFNVTLLIIYFCITLFILNLKPKIPVVILTLLFIYIHSLDMSYGKIGHGSNILALLLIGISLSYTFFSLQDRKKIVFAFSYAIVSFYYFQAFFSKIHYSPGLSWINGFSFPIWILMKEYDRLGSTGVFKLNFLQQILVENSYVAYILSGLALGTEMLGSVVFFVRQRYKFLILLSLTGLHLGIWYTMHIVFIENIYILLYLACDWFVVSQSVYKCIQSCNLYSVLKNLHSGVKSRVYEKWTAS